jgi:hypothetical protein
MSQGKYLVAAAVAMALGSAGANAAYLGPAVANGADIDNYNANVTSGVVVSVFLSGSTAVDTSITNIMAGNGTNLGLCASTTSSGTTISTLSIYYNSTTINNFTQRLFLCYANHTTTNLPSGTVLAVYKESTVGSANGIQPLLNIATGVASTLNFISASGLESEGAAGNCATNGLNAAASPVIPYNEYWNCPNNSTTVTTNGNQGVTGGIADVEARVLETPTGATINANQVASDLTTAPGLDVVWGVPVTKNLYYALQNAEGIITSATGACPANASSGTSANPGPSGNDAPSCAPSLSKEIVAGLYSGAIVEWSQLSGVSGPLSNTQAGDDNNVYLCRRDIGSGTEGSYEAYFLGARCSKSSLAMLPETGNFPYVWANPSTGSVLTCLQAFYAGGITLTTYYSPTQTMSEPGGQWAFGIASTELTPGKITAADDSFRMIAVDGVLPTLENTVNGYWPYFSTDATYYIDSGLTGSNYPSATSVTIFQKIQGLLGHPTFTAANDATYAGTPWGDGGDLAPASLFASSNPPTLPATESTVLANPVNAMTKLGSVGIDNCNTPILYSGITSAEPLEYSLLGKPIGGVGVN